MKFFFADSHDFIDPGFDFESESFTDGRRAQHDDVYPHEFFERAPYDGMLISRATVGDERSSGTYSTSQSLRFRREGAAKYLRYDPKAHGGAIMGDCGAFSYVNEENPKYSVPDMFTFYEECGFTHGVSIDHAILGYNDKLDTCSSGVPAEWERRFNLTLRLAEEFRHYHQSRKSSFELIGVAQGWSPKSYASAAKHLHQNLGYDYIALGGMAPLKSLQIRHCLQEIRESVPDARLHIFGFTKADEIDSFAPYNIESVDSTSPMLRAFKDGTRNYRLKDRWYTAIRVPQADSLHTLKKNILAGRMNQRQLRQEEAATLEALRGYASGKVDLESTIDALDLYGRHLQNSQKTSDAQWKTRLDAYRRTLTDRPWEKCDCKVCREIGIEVVVFRGANRNRRRGFHNLWQFHQQVHTLQPTQAPLLVK